ncbi:MAG: prepilin-type N-terminal cleavage/methylation domain-containing protein [Candidatus Omnitrophica bacterium]|nr:prepilin-type N-terminal cleavage/methylation domain-containing protein [Candidatus Omnitrophota bacterium]
MWGADTRSAPTLNNSYDLFNKHSSSSKGITLTELIVALVIVSIMMGGIFAANHAVMSLDRSGTDRAALYIKAQVIVDTIANDAMLAVGNASSFGYEVNSVANSANYLSFRTSMDPAESWIVYSLFDSTGTVYGNVLYRCVGGGTADEPCAAVNPFSRTRIGEISSDFSNAVFDADGFRMPVTVRDATINSEVTLEVVAYPEGHTF